MKRAMSMVNEIDERKEIKIKKKFKE